MDPTLYMVIGFLSGFFTMALIDLIIKPGLRKRVMNEGRQARRALHKQQLISPEDFCLTHLQHLANELNPYRNTSQSDKQELWRQGFLDAGTDVS